MIKSEAKTLARVNFPDDLSADVFISKYALKNPTTDEYEEFSLEDMIKRLSGAMVKIETKYNRKKMFKSDKNPTVADYNFLLHHFLFGGRTLYALGNEYDKNKSSFSNCYVIPIKSDSVEGIMECATEMAKTYRGGGGVGIDISVLRSDGMKVNNGSKTTSGSVSFIDLFSKITGVIGQNGRRGALMVTLDIKHPDIVNFIKLKGGDDLNVAQNCNMSVKISDDFMTHVVNGELDAEWNTSFTSNNETFVKTFKVGEIWDLLVQSAWNRAEPGLLYWDKIVSGDPSNIIPEFKSNCVNPCVTGDTWIDTDCGKKQVKDLIGKKFNAIVNGKSYECKSDGFFHTGYKEVIKLKFKSGIELKCTPDHLIQVYNAEYMTYMWCEAKDLLFTDGMMMGFSVVLNGKDENGYIRCDDVMSIENLESDDVYDCTIDDIHRFSANGIIVHNCGEISLESYGACNLGSINLVTMVNNMFVKPEFDYELFKRIIKLSVRALDLIIDENMNRQPLEQQKITMGLGRRIGLGFTGYADMLSMMNHTYGSQQALKFTDEILSFFHKEVLIAEVDLAIEKGAFPKWYEIDNQTKNKYCEHPYFDILPTEYKPKLRKHGVRNISFTTVAPNGSLSIIMGNITSGIEPIFLREYSRRVLAGGSEESYVVYHPLYRQWLNLFSNNVNYQQQCLLQCYLDGKEFSQPSKLWLDENYSELTKSDEYKDLTSDEIQSLTEVTKKYMTKKLFVQSDELNYTQRIETQSVIQNHISHSISSTINLPSNTPNQTISDIFAMSYKLNLKGVTVYRDGCRGNILSKIESDDVEYDPIPKVDIKDEYESKMMIIKSENKKWYVHYEIDHETKLPFSLFINSNSSQKENGILVEKVIESLNKLAEKYIPIEIINDNTSKIKMDSNITKMARMLSLLLRHRVKISEIISTIDKLEPPIYSFIFQIKKLLAKYLEGKKSGETCPECQNQLFHENGCIICKNCGFSKCS